ncbi:MAG: HepT-like ribonuclease domain-containing protein [Aridibacter sp.]
MNNKDNTIFLRHILDSISKIERYLQNFDFEKFKIDEEKIDAVVRNVEIIGEASNNLTRDFRSKNTSVEWRKIIATRNRIIHGYATVDLEIIWSITQKDLGDLKTEIERILEELEK